MFSEITIPDFNETDLKIYFSEKIHSGVDEYRQIIRKVIIQCLKERNIPVTVELMDLTEPPTDPSVGISLSHGKTCSIFAIDWKNRPLGIDVESPSRITDRLVERVADAAEMEACPDRQFLFSAKEACWKAINKSMNVATISNVQTSEWEKLNDHVFQFSAQVEGKSVPGRGYVYSHGDNLIGVFLGE